MARVKVETDSGNLIYALHTNLFSTMDRKVMQVVLNEVGSAICEAIQMEDFMKSEFEHYWQIFKSDLVRIMSEKEGGNKVETTE